MQTVLEKERARELLAKGKEYLSLSWGQEEAEGLLQSLSLSSLQ